MPLITPISTTEPLILDIPANILAVIPADPFEQLDIARKITSMAIASRTSKLEAEVEEKERIVKELREKAGRLEKALLDTEAKLMVIMEDNVKLSKERDALAMTNKKLGRDLSKLETFKRQLMQSLNEDVSPQTETMDIGTCDQTVPKVYLERDEKSNRCNAWQSYDDSGDVTNNIDEASRYTTQKIYITPYITPRLTPMGTPRIHSTAGSPRGYSAAASPRKTSGTSPAHFSFDGQSTMSSCYPSSQQSSAANSPPRARPVPARTARIDGKEFFRQARSRLSYEQFSAFLATIKDLNARKQTREETLKKAEEVFGLDNKDLYISFQALLNRNIQ